MFHELSQRYRAEFSNSLEAVRFGMSRDADDVGFARQPTPVLLVKGMSLTLKYLIRLRTFRLRFWRFEPAGHVLYALQIDDDPVSPGLLWSIAESAEELMAIKAIADHARFLIFLFNEDGFNIASASTHVTFQSSNSGLLTLDAEPAPAGAWKGYSSVVASLFGPKGSAKGLEAIPAVPCEWEQVSWTLVTQRLSRLELGLMSGEEGDQQEVLADWLVDALGGPVAVRNPVVHEPRASRELSDLLLSYEYGCFLLESKALAIFGRQQIPPRTMLRAKVLRQVETAARQLTGACANVRRGLRITDASGRDLKITRDQPIHCMILIPDLSILTDCGDIFVAKLSLRLLQNAKAFVHLLDPSELRRLVHNSGFMSAKSRALTPMMAFDGMLMKRFEFAGAQKTANFRFSMKLAPSES